MFSTNAQVLLFSSIFCHWFNIAGVKLKEEVTFALGIFYLSVKYAIINEYLDQVLKYSGI